MCGYVAAYVHSFCMLYCVERHVDMSTCLSTQHNTTCKTYAARNMYSNLAEKNKYNCFKLHHVGYLIKLTDGARNHKYLKKKKV
jgi:hypothetical protein